jgi:hypothetical protein
MILHPFKYIIPSIDKFPLNFKIKIICPIIKKLSVRRYDSFMHYIKLGIDIFRLKLSCVPSYRMTWIFPRMQFEFILDDNSSNYSKKKDLLLLVVL